MIDRSHLTILRAIEQQGSLTKAAASLHLTQSRSEEHTSELQSRPHLVCRLLLEKKKNHNLFPSYAFSVQFASHLYLWVLSCLFLRRTSFFALSYRSSPSSCYHSASNSSVFPVHD